MIINDFINGMDSVSSLSKETIKILCNTLVSGLGMTYAGYVDSETKTPRYYHNMRHILDCCEYLNKHQEDIGLFDDEYTKVFIALIFHDYVYKVGRDSEKNESESAICTGAILSLFFYQNKDDRWKTWLDDVEELINQTNHFGVECTDNYSHKVIRDIDLMGLGSSWENFKRNAELIRMEHQMYSDQEFYEGRMKFYETMLHRENIFHTSYFIEKFEEKARSNIERAIDEMV